MHWQCKCRLEHDQSGHWRIVDWTYASVSWMQPPDSPQAPECAYWCLARRKRGDPESHSNVVLRWLATVYLIGNAIVCVITGTVTE